MPILLTLDVYDKLMYQKIIIWNSDLRRTSSGFSNEYLCIVCVYIHSKILQKHN